MGFQDFTAAVQVPFLVREDPTTMHGTAKKLKVFKKKKKEKEIKTTPPKE